MSTVIRTKALDWILANTSVPLGPAGRAELANLKTRYEEVLLERDRLQEELEEATRLLRARAAHAAPAQAPAIVTVPPEDVDAPATEYRFHKGTFERRISGPGYYWCSARTLPVTHAAEILALKAVAPAETVESIVQDILEDADARCLHDPDDYVTRLRAAFAAEAK